MGFTWQTYEGIATNDVIVEMRDNLDYVYSNLANHVFNATTEGCDKYYTCASDWGAVKSSNQSGAYAQCPRDNTTRMNRDYDSNS